MLSGSGSSTSYVPLTDTGNNPKVASAPTAPQATPPASTANTETDQKQDEKQQNCSIFGGILAGLGVMTIGGGCCAGSMVGFYAANNNACLLTAAQVKCTIGWSVTNSFYSLFSCFRGSGNYPHPCGLPIDATVAAGAVMANVGCS